MMAKVAEEQDLCGQVQWAIDIRRDGWRQADVLPDLKPAFELLTVGHQLFKWDYV